MNHVCFLESAFIKLGTELQNRMFSIANPPQVQKSFSASPLMQNHIPRAALTFQCEEAAKEAKEGATEEAENRVEKDDLGEGEQDQDNDLEGDEGASN